MPDPRKKNDGKGDSGKDTSEYFEALRQGRVIPMSEYFADMRAHGFKSDGKGMMHSDEPPSSANAQAMIRKYHYEPDGSGGFKRGR